MKQGLQQCYGSLECLLNLSIFGFNSLLLSYASLELLLGLLTAQFVYSPLQGLDLSSCTFPNCSLRLSIICPLLCQLLRRKIGHPSTRRRHGRSPTFLVRHMAIDTVDGRGGRGGGGCNTSLGMWRLKMVILLEIDIPGHLTGIHA